MENTQGGADEVAAESTVDTMVKAAEQSPSQKGLVEQSTGTSDDSAALNLAQIPEKEGDPVAAEVAAGLDALAEGVDGTEAETAGEHPAVSVLDEIEQAVIAGVHDLEEKIKVLVAKAKALL